VSLARGASAAVVAVGLAVLLGWLLDIAALKSVWSGLATMKPNTALAFCLAGASAYLSASAGSRDGSRRRSVARIAALLVALLGLLTLGEYAFGWDLGIDQLLFHDQASTTGAPGRMSPITSLTLVLIGMALALECETRRTQRPAEWLTLVALSISLVALFGYIYEVEALYHMSAYTTVALHTALTSIVLCMAVLLACPRRGMMAVVTSGGVGGRLARRLLVAVIVLPIGLGALRLAGERAGLYHNQLGDIVVALGMSAGLGGLIWWSARALDRSEADLRHANRALKTLSESNQALVRAASEAELLATVCQAIVESGSYRMAWVGYAMHDAARTVRPVAQAGFEDGYLDTLQVTWDDSPHGHGPVGTAIRTGQPVIANDILRDPAFLPWRAQAAARGYTSLIALPLLSGGEILGALNIYASDRDAFDAAEARLLVELASDLGYGIAALRTRAAHERAEAQLRAQAARLNILADASRVFAEAGRDYTTLLDRIAQTMVEPLSDFCLVRVLSEDEQSLVPAAGASSGACDPELRAGFQAITGSRPLRVDEQYAPLQVFHSGAPLVLQVDEPASLKLILAPEFHPLVDYFKLRGLLIIPIRLHGRSIGLLTLCRFRSELPPFDQDDLTLAQDLADRAALAIDGARLFAQAQRSNAELEQRVQERTAEFVRANAELQAEVAVRARLEQHVRQDAARANALAELSQALAETSPEYQALFETIARKIALLVGDTCAVTLLSDDGRCLQTEAVYHPDPEGMAIMRALIQSGPYDVREGLVGSVVQSGQALLMPVVPQDRVRAQVKAEFRSYMDRFGMASLLIVPLRARHRILGTLGISRDRAGRPYTQHDQAFLQELADRAGMALENARLFAEVQQARATAERANQAKTNFLRATSHELRTPLNAIIGFTGMLLMKLPGPLTADQDRHLHTIQNSARHLLTLINELLDLAKIESGKVELQFEPVVCQEVIDQVAASLRPLAEQKGLALEVQVPERELRLLTDRRALSQILINLANNAIKFTSQGRVTIQASQQQANGMLRTQISVVDTGMGIRPEDLAGLFEPFARGANGSARAVEGSGLGLYLSQQLVGLLGGRLTCESEYTVGSRFVLVLEEQR
jgi:signal transduction histidine kinase